MTFWIEIAGLLRRMRVVVPLCLSALSVGALAFLLTPATYTSDTTQVLAMTQYGGTESRDPVSPTALSNPLLNFNESLRTTSAILIQSMSSKSVAAQLGATGSTTMVVNDGRTNPDLLGLNGPFLYIAVTSRSGDDARRVVEEAKVLMARQLLEWQQSLEAPPRTFVRLAEVVPPGAPRADHGRGTRVAMVLFAATFALGLGLVHLRGQLALRRTGRVGVGPAPSGATTVPAVGAAPRRPTAAPAAVAPPPADDVPEDADETDDETDDEDDDGAYEDDDVVLRARGNGYAQVAQLRAPVKVKGRARRR